MPTVVTLARIGLLYSLLMAALGIYNSYGWSERAYEVKLQRLDEPSKIEARANELQAELYFARSKQGSSQMLSHGLAAVLFLTIVRVRRRESDGGNAP